MGQKIHPYGFRVGVTRPWLSRWYADKKTYGRYLVEDQKIRRYIKQRLHRTGIPAVEIERMGEEVKIVLNTARPGIVIGPKGAEVDRLKDEVEKLTGKKVTINIKEVNRPDVNGQLVAESIAEQLAKRASFRRTMKKAVENVLSAGGEGIKVICKGRLGGAEIARSERYVKGKLPLQTLDADISYGFAESRTTYGVIGVKVWIYNGMMAPDGEEQ
jgi:small subunit ribosomal protein S3